MLNSYAADVRAYLSMFRALEIKWTEREVNLHYSPNWYRVYRAALIPRSKWIEANRLWTQAYKLERPQLLPGARRVLRTLAAEFELGIVTSGNRARVRRQLREFGLADYFSACVCNEDAAKKKPNPAPLQLALKRLAPRARAMRIRRRHGGRHRDGSARRRARHRCSRSLPYGSAAPRGKAGNLTRFHPRVAAPPEGHGLKSVRRRLSIACRAGLRGLRQTLLRPRMLPSRYSV